MFLRNHWTLFKEVDMKKSKIEDLCKEHECADFAWINPADIIVSQWVRVKCTFGCGDYGRAVCPPNTPSVDECRSFFKEYTHGVIFRFNFTADKESYPVDLSKKLSKNLLAIERDVFLNGYHKAFMLNQTCCDICSECKNTRSLCVNLSQSRPSPEGFAVDVYQTVRKLGLEINVVATKHQKINRYAFLMIE